MQNDHHHRDQKTFQLDLLLRHVSSLFIIYQSSHHDSRVDPCSLSSIVRCIKTFSTKAHGCDCLLYSALGRSLLTNLLQRVLQYARTIIDFKSDDQVIERKQTCVDMLTIVARLERHYRTRQRHFRLIQTLNRYRYNSDPEKMMDIDSCIISLISMSGLLSLYTLKIFHYQRRSAFSRDDTLVGEPLCVQSLNTFTEFNCAAYDRDDYHNMTYYQSLYSNLISLFLLNESMNFSSKRQNLWMSRNSLFERLCLKYTSESFGRSKAHCIMYRFSIDRFKDHKFVQRVCTRLCQSNSLFILQKLHHTVIPDENSVDVMNSLFSSNPDHMGLLINSIIRNLLTTGSNYNVCTSDYVSRVYFESDSLK